MLSLLSLLLLASCTFLGQVTVDHNRAPFLAMPCEAQQTIENPELMLRDYGIQDDHMGRSLALGDWDGDGYLDLAVGGFRRVKNDSVLAEPCCPPTVCEDMGTSRVFIFAWDPVMGSFDTDPIAEFVGNNQRDQFGECLTFMPDIDGDNRPELLVGAPNWPNNPNVNGSGCTTGYQRRGRVYLFGSDTTYSPSASAETCATLVFQGRARGGRFGAEVAVAPNFDDDGLADLFIGAPGSLDSAVAYAGEVHVMLGADLASLTQDDDCMGSTTAILDNNAAFSAHLTSGTGQDRFGEGLAVVGDLDGDFRDEIAVGATEWVQREVNNYDECGMQMPGKPCEEEVAKGPGFARLYTYALLPSPAVVTFLPVDLPTTIAGSAGQYTPGSTIPGLGAGEAFGYAIGGMADVVDEDGVSDVYVSAPGFTDGMRTRVGRVRVYSGAALAAATTAQEVADAERYWVTGDRGRGMFGSSVAPVDDLFGNDNFAEFAVGAYQEDLCGFDDIAMTGHTCPPVLCSDLGYTLPDTTIDPSQGWDQSGSVYVIQTKPADGGGVRGDKRVRIIGEHRKDHMGFSVAAGLITDDGVPDLVVSGMAWNLKSTSTYNMSEPGRVYLFHGDKYPVANSWVGLGYSKAGTNGDPVAWGIGEFVSGGPYRVGLENALPNEDAYIIEGVSQAYTPFFGGVLVPLFYQWSFVTTDDNGNAEYASSYPGVVGPGDELVMQWWFVDPAGTMSTASTAGIAMQEP